MTLPKPTIVKTKKECSIKFILEMKTAVQNLYQNLIDIPEVMNLPMDLIQKITSEFNDAHDEERTQIEFAFKNGLNSDCLQEQNEDFFAEKFYNKTFK